MKKQVFVCFLLLVFALLSTILTGCNAPGLTSKEINQRHYEAIQNNLWQMQDDFDAMFMIDRPMRTGRMMVR